MPGKKFKIKKAKIKDFVPYPKHLIFFVAFAILLANLKVTPVLASETLTFVHQDHLSSTTLATNEQGEVVSRAGYELERLRQTLSY